MPRAREQDPVEWVRERWQQQGLPEADRFAAVAAMMRAHQLLVSGLEVALKPHDISRTGYLLLVTLALSDGETRTLGSLSRYLMVHPTTVTQLMGQLEKRELAERRPHPTDRRITLAVLGGKGRELVRTATADPRMAGFGLRNLDGDAVTALSAALHDVRQAAGDLAAADA